MLWKIFIILMTLGAFFSVQSVVAAKPALQDAIFAGGCFWCMESPFEKIDGVVDVVSGYTGGEKEDPTYEEVSAGGTGHLEAVLITFDPARVSYAKLLEVFWMQVDPTDAGGQFVDRGEQYATAIFYANEDQRRLAEESKKKLQNSGRFKGQIVTPILEASRFYRAEEYHQDYYKRNSIRYKFYRARSGRDRFLDDVWAVEARPQAATPGSRYTRPGDDELRSRLTPLQYEVTQNEGTERAFENEYWDNKRVGIYVDIVSGEPLFASTDKFDSGTGWPSFTRPIASDNIVEREDKRLFINRTEVRSRHGGSHLGHVFNDGPGPGGLRYCINSASLRFVPGEELEKEGYGEYKRLFEQ